MLGARGESRIDLAGELYDTTVFEGATYAALAKRRRPFVILHATSMANGAPFEFTQMFGGASLSVPTLSVPAVSSPSLPVSICFNGRTSAVV